MRLANLRGRAAIVSSDGSRAVDVEQASDGRFGPDLPSVYAAWPDFSAWAASVDADAADANGSGTVDAADLGAPSPAPSQIFAIGLNYRAHAAEVGKEPPDVPMVFTKFASSLTGPVGRVRECRTMDWEVEMVVVLGRGGRDIPVDEAWAHVAGLTAGQDISHRKMQGSGAAPQQWAMAKSLEGFSPTGPWLVTADELDAHGSKDDLAVESRVNGQAMQSSRTSDLIFAVPALVEYLSSIVELRPGDLIFTGTPSGVAVGRPDKPWLKAGDVLETTIEGIGDLRQEIVDA